MISSLEKDPIVFSLMPTFLSSLKSSVNNMAAALEDENRAELKRLAHAVKGSSACYGFTQISQLAGRLEEMSLDVIHSPVGMLREILEQMTQMSHEATSTYDQRLNPQ